MSDPETLRLQLSFDAKYEPDICLYLASFRKSDRHGIIAHALRILMNAENFQSRINGSIPKIPQAAPLSTTGGEDNTDATEHVEAADYEDMTALGRAF